MTARPDRRPAGNAYETTNVACPWHDVSNHLICAINLWQAAAGILAWAGLVMIALEASAEKVSPPAPP